VIDAIFQIVGEFVGALADVILQFLVRRFNISLSRGLNFAIKVIIYLLLLIPTVILLLNIFMYVGVLLINWFLRGATS
jgi:hypothetical protein